MRSINRMVISVRILVFTTMFCQLSLIHCCVIIRTVCRGSLNHNYLIHLIGQGRLNYNSDLLCIFTAVEYDNLSRLGITDVQSYLKRRFKSKSIVYLKTCCAGPLVVGNLEAAVDEALSSGTWLDIMVTICFF